MLTMRVIKEPEVRKNEILNITEELFVRKGFDKATVNDILNAVGIAKGTFYYYFKSKEEVLDAIVRRRINEGLEKARIIAANSNLGAGEKLLAIILAQKPQNPAQDEFTQVLHEQGNALLHQKILISYVTELSPVLTDIIKEGINQSIFNTDYPRESIEILLSTALVIFDDAYFRWSAEEQTRRVCAFIVAMERILGAKPGSLAGFVQVFGTS